jgi:molybdopterin molybdotransferase
MRSLARRSHDHAAAAPDPHTGRPSVFDLVTCDEAWQTLARFRPLGRERVRVVDAVGRVLARDVRAPMDVPHFTRSYMDGFAVRAADTRADGARLRITATIEMGKPARRRLRPGEAQRIPTGGMLPAGADAVVMVEHTRELADATVEVRHASRQGEHVMNRGDDVRRGARLYAAGHRVRPLDVGALSGAGVTHIDVHRRPRVAVIATGDEIVPPEVRPGPGQVRNVNHHALRAMIADEGGETIDLGVLPDRLPAITRALTRGLRDADLVLMSGGSSVGTKDLTPAVIGAIPGARILVHGIRVKPGKPTLIAQARTTPIVGLPGHPVSALVIFVLFAVPVMRLLSGEPLAEALRPRRTVRARLAADVASQEGRDDFVRVRLEDAGDDLVAHPLGGGSAEVFSLVQADGLMRIARELPRAAAGDTVVVQLLR